MSCGGTIRVGISGWTYAGWRGSFYPKALPHAQQLAYASRQVDTIEINGTHYCLQRPDDFARWRDDSPEGFVFAVKGSRFITHLKQLHDIETPLANFFASGVLRLEEKLGPFLWQFSPRFRFDRERLDNFLSLLPRDTEAAAASRGASRSPARRPRLDPHRISTSAKACVSRSAIRVFSIRDLSSCCAAITWRLSLPIWSIGPMPRM